MCFGRDVLFIIYFGCFECVLYWSVLVRRGVMGIPAIYYLSKELIHKLETLLSL